MLESYNGDNVFALPIEGSVMEGAESDLSGHPGVSDNHGSDYVSKFRDLMQSTKIVPEVTTRGLSQLLRTTWPGGSSRGQYWVGDLAVEFDIAIESNTGKVGFDIVEAGVHYEGEIDVETGKLVLSIDGGEKSFISSEEGDGFEGPTVEGQTAIRGRGAHTIRYSNFDNEIVYNNKK